VTATTRLQLFLVILALSTPAAKADVTDVAELFPADTLAYAEVARPGEFAASVAALFRGTPLADPMRFAHDRLDKAPTPQDAAAARRVGWLALVAAPEFAAEAKRFRGAAVGLVGFSARHEPRFVAAVLLGESHAAGLAVRAFLAAGSDVRRIGEIDGVAVFQHRAFAGRPADENGKPVPEEKPAAIEEQKGGPAEWTYAYTPGLFVAGSDRDAVGDVLRQFAGKVAGKSLAAADAFWECRPARERPGVFLYATLPALAAKLEAAKKAGGAPVDSDLFALLRFTLNLKAVKLVRGNLTLGPGAVTLTAEADLDPNAAGPVAGLLAGPALPRDSFTFAGQPGWAVSASLPEEDRRAKSVLAFLDGVARANGTLGRLPSQAVAEADRGPGPKVADELLRSVKAVTVFAPAKPELPAGGRPLPLLALRLESDGDAEKWQDAASKLVALVAGTSEPLTPAAEAVNGVRVVSAAGKGLPGNTPWHCARSGPVVAFGQDRKLVAEAVAGKGATPAFPAGFGEKDPSALAVFTPARLVAHLIPRSEPGKSGEVKVAEQPQPVLMPFPGLPGLTDSLQLLQPGPAPPGEPLAVGLARAVEPLPPVFAAVRRDRDVLRVELRLPDPGKPVAAAAERFLGWLEKQAGRSEQNIPGGMYLPGRW
jgi:hypothetical protein